ncbi:hypothetical protein F8M41_018415 [Gigaspora margarita]|uniref:Uncharacterized protein n=1 Tax=Gigaspora margarita TaxID=4874 RepID=A0A8H4ALK4_GIGMA|nr:hypothetical protein F8M41_018415 [Gigaspora margarita]
MSNSLNKNLASSSKYNKFKSHKIDTDDQSTLTNLVLTDLINNVVERAKKPALQISLLNNNSGSELQDNPDSELQEHEYASDIQEFEPNLQETDPESLEELESELELQEEPELQEEAGLQESALQEEPKLQET